MDVRHIMIASDLSWSTRAALDLGGSLAARLGARVTLLHVDALEPTLLGLDAEPAIRSRRAPARDAALAEGLACLVAAGSMADAVVLEGEPVETITQAAVERDVDLVVIARVGRDGADGLRLGGTAEALLRATAVPVLVVPPHTGRLLTVHRILATSDLGAASVRGVRYACHLGRRLEVPVDVVHVLHVPTLANGGRAVEDRELAPLVEQQRGRLALQLREAACGGLTHVVAERGGSVARGIVRAAGTLSADLIISPAHGAGPIRAPSLGIIPERVVSLAEVPVLVLPQAALYDARCQ